jgi:hypothetical protein
VNKGGFRDANKGDFQHMNKRGFRHVKQARRFPRCE